MKDTSIEEKLSGSSPLVSLETLRRALSGALHNSSKAATKNDTMSSVFKVNSTVAGLNGTHIGMRICDCLQHLCPIGSTAPHTHASGKNIMGVGNSEDSLSFNSEFGRMIYTIAILLMFSSVILLLMIRSIKRSSSTIEVEALLDAMRFREELDLQQRQKRRLQKAKNKVTAWLSRTNGKMWTSSPQIVPVPKITTNKPADGNRTNSIQSGGSYLPEIVISNSEESGAAIKVRQNSCTPSLSLIYDFNVDELAVAAGIMPTAVNGHRKQSECSDATVDLSQLSDFSFNSSSDLMLVPEADEDIHAVIGNAGNISPPAMMDKPRSASVAATLRPTYGHGNFSPTGAFTHGFTFRNSRNSLQLTTLPHHIMPSGSGLLGKFNDNPRR
ncbi:CBR-MPS-1 protein [Ditylenchus destructor]|uniref:CBR-MPS-1 protein n=1 Tax=Ditylenchus destructor TaxID=166010 RepID=A0AAD4NGS9_9BILA|nr:CBR-MPS-1 protein [Ditylenchus destructor]